MRSGIKQGRSERQVCTCMNVKAGPLPGAGAEGLVRARCQWYADRSSGEAVGGPQASVRIAQPA